MFVMAPSLDIIFGLSILVGLLLLFITPELFYLWDKFKDGGHTLLYSGPAQALQPVPDCGGPMSITVAWVAVPGFGFLPFPLANCETRRIGKPGQDGFIY